jgi:hypothetical protein
MMTRTRLRMVQVSFHCGFASNVKRACEKHSFIVVVLICGNMVFVFVLPRLPAMRNNGDESDPGFLNNDCVT